MLHDPPDVFASCHPLGTRVSRGLALPSFWCREARTRPDARIRPPRNALVGHCYRLTGFSRRPKRRLGHALLQITKIAGEPGVYVLVCADRVPVGVPGDLAGDEDQLRPGGDRHPVEDFDLRQSFGVDQGDGYCFLLLFRVVLSWSYEVPYYAVSRSEIPASRTSMPSAKRSEISPVWTVRITPARSRR
jgi:hypothetical protein